MGPYMDASLPFAVPRIFPHASLKIDVLSAATLVAIPPPSHDPQFRLGDCTWAHSEILRLVFLSEYSPVIIAQHVARGSLEVPELSDGAQDFLYLAFRFAVIEEHNATREPVPFIAADLLLNLDDRRATATLRVLARIAQTSQVLLVTHHEHMIPLAPPSCLPMS